jgi:catechol 2,3-dioxygenase-like lactoylglutathione lyase family enzyme
VQLALNVSDIDAAVEFYSLFFSTQPAKRQPGYANFEVQDPPLKLVLIENPGRGNGASGALNHLGVEVDTAAAVERAADRLDVDGLPHEAVGETTCCYAVQSKVWTDDPDGTPWEVYVVLADASNQTGLGCSEEACRPAPEQSVLADANPSIASGCC